MLRHPALKKIQRLLVYRSLSDQGYLALLCDCRIFKMFKRSLSKTLTVLKFGNKM